jgi:hypothetical protein
VPVNFPFAQGFIPYTAKQWRDDFACPTNAFREYWETGIVGTAAVSLLADANGTLGRVQLSATNAGTNSLARLFTNYAFVAPANGFLLWQCDCIVPTLSVPADRFMLQLGFCLNTIPQAQIQTIPAEGFGIRYSDDINDGKWQLWSAFNTTWTFADSAVAVVANTRYKFRIISPTATGPIIYMVNDRIVGSINTNVPNGLPLMTQVSIAKTVGNANARTFNMDYAGLAYMRSDI